MKNPTKIMLPEAMHGEKCEVYSSLNIEPQHSTKLKELTDLPMNEIDLGVRQPQYTVLQQSDNGLKIIQGGRG